MKARILFHGAAILVLAATVAAAQTSTTPSKPSNQPSVQPGAREASVPSVSEREAQSGQASGRKSGSIVVLDRDASSTSATSAREASSGMASGKRQHQPILTVAADDASLNARNSAHATESLNTDKLGNAQSNPMYKDKGMTGNNPLYEPKDKQAAPKPGTSHDTVEYKDPEDMTTRYRPGNNKTSTTKPASGTPTPPPTH